MQAKIMVYRNYKNNKFMHIRLLAMLKHHRYDIRNIRE
jgi:hypothetical protein